MATVDPANTSRLYRMLQRMDGRERETFTFQCPAPIHSKSKIDTGPTEKCEVLAAHFYGNLNAPGVGSRGH